MNFLMELHKRLSAELPDQEAVSRVVDIIREEYGGCAVYVPLRSPFIEAAVRSAAEHMSTRAAARACGVTERYAYRVIHRIRAERQAG